MWSLRVQKGSFRKVDGNMREIGVRGELTQRTAARKATRKPTISLPN